MNKYYFFLDETGDHGLTYIDSNFPLFLLCGCLFSENGLSKAKDLINGFKRKYFRTEEVIMPEMRGKREDSLFISHYNSVMDSGTYHVSSIRFKNRIYTAPH